jgi:hypothetical protein
MRILERLVGWVTGTAKQSERGRRGADGTTDGTVGGLPAGDPAPPELPLDDDGNNARNIGG